MVSTGDEKKDKAVLRPGDSVEVENENVRIQAEFAEQHIPEVKIINPTLSHFRVGGKTLKIREMNNKKIKKFLELIADTMEEIFGGEDISIKSKKDFMGFIKKVPEKRINQFINFVFATKEDPKPMTDGYIDEWFTPRLIQVLFKEVLRQNALTGITDFIKGQLPGMIKGVQKIQA